MVITKNGQGTAHATATYEHELLADGLTKKQMLPYRARVRARSIDEFDGWVRHDGEEFLYVLTGVFAFIPSFTNPSKCAVGIPPIMTQAWVTMSSHSAMRMRQSYRLPP